MEHIKQNDEGLLPVIQSVGCFVRSCGLAAEYKLNKALNKEQINELWKWGKASGKIDADDNVKESAALMNRALRMLGDDDHYFAEIGIGKVNPHGVYAVELYPWADRKGLVPDTFIQKILQGGPSKYHYRLVDDRLQLIEDPHRPAIGSLGMVYTICYKYCRG